MIHVGGKKGSATAVFLAGGFTCAREMYIVCGTKLVSRGVLVVVYVCMYVDLSIRSSGTAVELNFIP